MEHRYFVLTEAFAKKYNNYEKDGKIFTYAITRDGRYVNSVNTVYEDEFSNIYNGYAFPIVTLTSNDFLQDSETGEWIVDLVYKPTPLQYIIVSETFKNTHHAKFGFGRTFSGKWAVHESVLQLYPEYFDNETKETELLAPEDFAFDKDNNAISDYGQFWRSLIGLKQ